MAGSSADGATEPISRKRQAPMSWACEATLAADAASALWFSQQSKDHRQRMKGVTYMERKNMGREDHVSEMHRHADNSAQIILDLQAEIQAIQAAERPPAGTCTEPRFSAGQSVLQWWASWFKEDTAKPKQYKKKRRPTWFSGEILNPAVWTEGMLYAGVVYTGWVYPTH